MPATSIKKVLVTIVIAFCFILIHSKEIVAAPAHIKPYILDLRAANSTGAAVIDAEENAMIAGKGRKNLLIPNNSILDTEFGTISFWVKPLDWQPDDDSFHVFFEAKGPISFILYKYFQDSKLIWLVGDVASKGQFDAVEHRIDWPKRRWQHLAVTWSDKKIALYLNGSLTAEKPRSIFPVRNKPKTISFGDQSWDTDPSGQTLLKDLQIFTNELNEAEISSLSNMTGATEPAEFGIKSKLDLDSPSGRTSITLKAEENQFLERDHYSVQLRIKIGNRASDKLPPYPKLIPLKVLIEGITIPLENPMSNPIEIQYDIEKSGILVTSIKHEIDLPDLHKLKSSQLVDAISKLIPPPWNDLKYDSNSVTTDRFKFTFCPKGLICKIDLLDESILSEPIALLISRHGQNLNVISTDLKLKKAEDRIQYKYDLHWSDKKIASISGYIEFDGMLWLEIKNESGEIFSDPEISIEVQIPLTGMEFDHLHRWTNNWADSNLSIAKKNGILFQSPFTPFVWLGSESKGIFWFSESAKHWPNASSPKAINLKRDMRGTLLSFNIKRPGQKISPSGSISFGLLPTPAKPLPLQKTDLRLSPLHNSNISIIWPDTSDSSFKYYGHLLPKNGTKHRDRLVSLRKQGLKVIPYFCPTFISNGMPEWGALEKEWNVGIHDNLSRDVMAYGTRVSLVSPHSITWGNFLINSIAEYAQEFGLDGIYLDNIQLYGIYSPRTGHGYIKDQISHPTFAMRAQREHVKSIYKYIKSVNPEALIIGHSSGRLALPILSFVDIYVDGEQFRNRNTQSYFDLISLDTFRTEFTGIQFGLKPLFLPQIMNKSGPEPTARMMTLLAIHNVDVWPIWSDLEYINKFYRTLNRVRPTESIFTSYTHTDKSFRSSNPNLLVSTHCNLEACLLLAANISKSRQMGTICSDTETVFRKYRDQRNILGPEHRSCVDVFIEPEKLLLLRSTAQ